MAVTRRDVLERLASESDADAVETVTVEAFVDTFTDEERRVRKHLEGLASCELARFETESEVRITVTGEELLALDLDEMVIVDPKASETG